MLTRYIAYTNDNIIKLWDITAHTVLALYTLHNRHYNSYKNDVEIITKNSNIQDWSALKNLNCIPINCIPVIFLLHGTIGQSG